MKIDTFEDSKKSNCHIKKNSYFGEVVTNCFNTKNFPMKVKALLFMFSLALVTQGALLANTNVINLEDHKEGIISLEDAASHNALTKEQFKQAKKLEKKQKRTERRMAKLQKFMKSKKGQKMLGGLDDPVDKWFWFWIFGWGAAIVLAVLVPLLFLSGGLGGAALLTLLISLVGLFGTVSLIIWLVKKFA